VRLRRVAAKAATAREIVGSFAREGRESSRRITPKKESVSDEHRTVAANN
jgi:hypothetical protein